MAIPDAGTSTVDAAFVEAFKSNVIHLSQQHPSRLRPTVDSMTVKAETANVERMGTKEAVEKTTRHTPTPILDVPHDRRRLSMQDFQWADLIDEEDQIRMLISPKSEYAKSGAWAMNRQYDRLIIEAATGSSTDGEGVAVPFNPAMTIGAGGGGLTLDLILEAKEKLDANEVDSSSRYMVLNSAAMSDLLGTTEVTSSDFNTVKALVKGEINTWMGFSIVHTELVAETTPQVLCYHKSALRLGIGRDILTRIDKRFDVSYADQVYLAFTAGATRVEEEKIVQILI
jgi:hypothetical protein